MPPEKNDSPINRYAWIILAVVYMATFAGNMILNRVSPLLLALTEDFGVNLSQVGLMMSVIGLMGLILAIPAGIILQRFGLRVTGTFALGLMAFGTVIGAISGSFNILLFSRLLEGIGLAFIIIVSPSALAMWFPAARSGTPMGIWSTAAPLALFTILSLAPLLALNIGWRGVWWLTAGVACVALVLYWLFMRPAPEPATAGPSESGESVADAPPGWTMALKDRDIWLMASGILIFSLIVTPLLTFYPTFLTSIHDIPETRAGLIAGLMGLGTLASAPLTGWLSDTIGSRKWVAITAFLLLLPLNIIAYQVSGGWIVVVALLLGFVAISIPVAIFAAIPEVVIDVRLAGIGIAVLIFGQNIGLFISPPIYGRLIDGVGWQNAIIFFAPLCLLGALFTYLTKKMP